MSTPVSPPVIRVATPADAPAIAAIHVQSWRETYAGLMPGDFLDRMTGADMQARREAFWAQNITAGQDVVRVAEAEGTVLAFASAGEARDHPGFDSELFTLYALRAAQGHGTGLALLRAVMGALRERGQRSMALWVLDVNPTRHWYARQGGVEGGEKRDGDLRELRMGWSDLGTLH
ncbi:GNAT family N-acetyltransferase [Deinococcus aquaticus]|uniref:GNAT family N-acetyltransferase n=1 Tax=Deinococcus aquaticus TaxID=328692 RepID=UPI003F487588